ncbi:hypothetical protein QTP88_008535 [Uroleucon formosanum]
MLQKKIGLKQIQHFFLKSFGVGGQKHQNQLTFFNPLPFQLDSTNSTDWFLYSGFSKKSSEPQWVRTNLALGLYYAVNRILLLSRNYRQKIIVNFTITLCSELKIKAEKSCPIY